MLFEVFRLQMAWGVSSHSYGNVFSVDLVCKEELNLMLVELVNVRWVRANSPRHNGEQT